MPAEPNVSRTEQTRERIVATAFLLVRRVGLRHLAMDAVAAEAGVSRAALYRYFANKQALLDEVLEENARRWRLALTELLAGKRTLAGKVGAAARFGHFPPEDLLLLGLAETDPESLAVLLTTGAHRFLQRAIRFWAPHVAEARERGEIARSVDPDQGAEWIARSFYGLSTLPGLTFDSDDPASLERFARSFILSGLRDR
ncbi:MAG TPA: TetR/AcrR family transcriptional regulator [Myxococcota bacterium]|nr:TetR/AcrR family transcriptional regulator [Myxococcota bacterium]